MSPASCTRRLARGLCYVVATFFSFPQQLGDARRRPGAVGLGWLGPACLVARRCASSRQPARAASPTLRRQAALRTRAVLLLVLRRDGGLRSTRLRSWAWWPRSALATYGMALLPGRHSRSGLRWFGRTRRPVLVVAASRWPRCSGPRSSTCARCLPLSGFTVGDARLLATRERPRCSGFATLDRCLRPVFRHRTGRRRQLAELLEWAARRADADERVALSRCADLGRARRRVAPCALLCGMRRASVDRGRADECSVAAGGRAAGEHRPGREVAARSRARRDLLDVYAGAGPCAPPTRGAQRDRVAGDGAAGGCSSSTSRPCERLEQLAAGTRSQIGSRWSWAASESTFDRIRRSRTPRVYHDSAFVLSSRPARRLDRYDKTHLVPFGEYVPLRGLLGGLLECHREWHRSRPTSLRPALRPRALVELADRTRQRRVRRAVRGWECRSAMNCCSRISSGASWQTGDGARLLLAITNDAWYGRTGAPHQFLAMTAIRSAETGVCGRLRAANTGVSARSSTQRGRVREAHRHIRSAICWSQTFRYCPSGCAPIDLLRAPTEMCLRSAPGQDS